MLKTTSAETFRLTFVGNEYKSFCTDFLYSSEWICFTLIFPKESEQSYVRSNDSLMIGY